MPFILRRIPSVQELQSQDQRRARYADVMRQCLVAPRVPITQIGERAGSGKLTLNKSGANGTRIWQVPWFMHPRFCDHLLGRVAPRPGGMPQLHRPDVFSPCYPWLYCQEVSVEGEDLLGVDMSLRAFYRRAIVTAKYMPMEQGNSIHINSQMLTIPGSQFIFVGLNPGRPLGATQTFTMTTQGGPPTGGTFRLVLSPTSSSLPGAPTPVPVYTPPIRWNATAGQITHAIRTALGLQPGTFFDTAVTNGPAGGPWTLGFISNTGYVISAQTVTADGFTGGLTYDSNILRLRKSTEYDDTDYRYGGPPAVRFDSISRGSNAYTFALEYVRRPRGTFKLRFTFADGTKRDSAVMNTETLHGFALVSALEPIVRGITSRPTPTGGLASTASDRNYCFWYTQPFVNGVLRDSSGDTGDGPPFLASATDPRHNLRMYVSIHNISKAITDVEIADSSINPTPPTIRITSTDPFLADRLDQNIAKTVAMGEITYQRHQILAFHLGFFLQAVGSVNMFTFLGFPPWTLLLTGIEAKQTRLPNGAPAFDITFKLAFNPYTHQALFRPSKMRWEFVRGILQVRIPNNRAVPPAPFDRESGRSGVDPIAMRSAWDVPRDPPREITTGIDPRTGRPITPTDRPGVGPVVPGGGGGGPVVGGGGGGGPGVFGVSPSGGNPWIGLTMRSKKLRAAPPGPEKFGDEGDDQREIDEPDSVEEGPSIEEEALEQMDEDVESWDEADDESGYGEEEAEEVASEIELLLEEMGADLDGKDITTDAESDADDLSMGDTGDAGAGVGGGGYDGEDLYNAFQNNTMFPPGENPLENPAPIPGDGTADPAQYKEDVKLKQWVEQAGRLGDFIKESVGAEDGQMPNDQAAAASGIAYDIEQARQNGADWVDALTTGEDTSSDTGGGDGGESSDDDTGTDETDDGSETTDGGTDGGTDDNLSAQMARMAARRSEKAAEREATKLVRETAAMGAFAGDPGRAFACVINDIKMGIRKSKRTCEVFGIPYDDKKGGPDVEKMEKMGMSVSTGLFTAISSTLGGTGRPSPEAMRVGAAGSVEQMRIFDLGFIYPIADWTPIVWMQ